MDRKKLFADRLKGLMTERGLNQAALAKELGITNQAVSLWLSGKREAGMNSLCLLADFFDCSIDYLCGREND